MTVRSGSEWVSPPGGSHRVPRMYLGILVVGVLCFLPALVSGVWRIALTRGFVLAPVPEWFPPHGHLMLGGFLGSLILFERMTGLRINGLLWVPYAFAISSVFTHTGSIVAKVVQIAALLGWFAHRWKAWHAFHQLEKPAVEAVALATLSSALNFPGGLQSGPAATLTALSFPVAVILIERLEMSLHFRRRGARLTSWGIGIWCLLWNCFLWLKFPPMSIMAIATAVVCLTCAYYDVALRTKATKSGPPLQQYLKTALITSYLWLFFGTLVLILWEYVPGAVTKDIAFHVIGLGFIFSMILGHGPLILPATMGKLPPSKAPWIPFLAFQAATVVRIAGDFSVTSWITIWTWTGWISGAIHILSILAFALTLMISVRKSSRDDTMTPPYQQ